MSATLTWYNSGLGTKTGTAIANAIDDLDTLVLSKAADSNFSWEKAGKSSAGTPYWYLIKPKGGGVGRIAIICWTSAPAGNNAAILDIAPTTNQFYIVWFPNGNVDTLSNLTASSGTICGDDTNCVKCTSIGALSSIYTTSFQWYYFDSAEAVVFGTGHTGTTTMYWGGAGLLLVDSADVAYGATIGGTVSGSGFATGSWGVYNVSGTSAGSTTGAIRTNYGAANRSYYPQFITNGWGNVAYNGTGDILSNTSLSQIYFAPMPIITQSAKGVGPQLKMRQIAYGPGSSGSFTTYNVTGPVVGARNWCPSTTAQAGCPWFINQKI